jgi:hypothetical protein
MMTYRSYKASDAIVKRLRTSKENYVQEAGKDGRKAGRLWAANEAEYHELRWLEIYWEAASHDVGLADLKCALDPNDALPPEKFYERINCVGEFKDSDEWANGFAQGATEVYDDVQDEIDK